MRASLIGRRLGNYEITELLGHGGMATVYKGYQASIDRNVAIKVLPPHPGRDPKFEERFRLEATAVARLQHPHILPLFDFGTTDDILYLVMALAEGGSLEQQIGQRPLPLRQVSTIVEQVASALDYAHRHNVIHRDIKPDNILFHRDGYVMLADFGIAKMVGEEANLTQTGGVVGTPAYMSPEQAQGGRVGPASDIYSLGAVAYEMLTGKLPYHAETAVQMMLQHVSAPVPSLSDALTTPNPELDVVIQRVLAKEMEDRYATAGEFAADLSRAVSLSATDTLTALPDEGTRPTLNITPPAPSRPTTEPSGLRTTMSQSGTVNLAVLGGALVIISLLVAIILVLALDSAPDPIPVVSGPEPTEAVVPTLEPTIAATSVPTFGELAYSTNEAIGDTIRLRVENLDQPGGDQVYAAWLVNTRTDERLALGEMNVDPLGDGVLTYTDPDGTKLPTRYNAVEITVENEIGAQPGGEVAYSGMVPAAMTDVLTEIFIESEAGANNGSLLATAIREAQIAQQHAGLASNAGTVASMQNHAEHTINILLGTNDDLDGDGRPVNPGAGVGLAPMLTIMRDRLDAIATHPEATPSLQVQLDFIRVCVNNTQSRMDDILEIERMLLAATDTESVDAAAAEAEELARLLVDGEDLNLDGTVQRFEGECGLDQIDFFGVSVANIEIVAGSLNVQS